MRVVFALGAFLLVIGCGGSSAPNGGSSDPNQPVDPLPPIQTEPADMRRAMDDVIDAFSNPVIYTEIHAIPTAGSAVYEGYLSAELSNQTDSFPDELVANMKITVRFDANGVSATGRATNFYDENNNALSGSLVLSAGQLDRTGNPNNDATFTAALDGELEAQSGQIRSIETRLEGDFLGAQQNALGGALFGRALKGGIVQDIDGSFVAAR